MAAKKKDETPTYEVEQEDKRKAQEEADRATQEKHIRGEAN